jgi:WD repeat-containing protein 42A
VTFFGPRSEFILSGSQCGNIFVWQKKSGSIVQFLKGSFDERGCLCIPHPDIPVLASVTRPHGHLKIWSGLKNSSSSKNDDEQKEFRQELEKV